MPVSIVSFCTFSGSFQKNKTYPTLLNLSDKSFLLFGISERKILIAEIVLAVIVRHSLILRRSILLIASVVLILPVALRCVVRLISIAVLVLRRIIGLVLRCAVLLILIRAIVLLWCAVVGLILWSTVCLLTVLVLLFLLLTIPDRNVVKGANQAFDRFACRAVLFLIQLGGQVARNADERAFFRFAEGTYKEVTRTAGNVGRCLILSVAFVDSQIEYDKFLSAFVLLDLGFLRESPDCSELKNCWLPLSVIDFFIKTGKFPNLPRK